MTAIDDVKAASRKAKRQRDNWKRRGQAYREYLRLIRDGFLCCGRCSGPLVYCPVGWAKRALSKEENGKE